MNNSELQILIQHLAAASKRSAARSIARLRTSDDPTVLIVAAIFDVGPNTTLARAGHVAQTTRDRQLVAISSAYLAGDQQRAEALIREHLVDHPDHPIVAWISANGETERPRSRSGSTFSGWLEWIRR